MMGCGRRCVSGCGLLIGLGRHAGDEKEESV